MSAPRFSLTIYRKLIALIVALMVTVVGALALYLSSQQIEAMTAALRAKAGTYGAVMSAQTTSAVAFSDRETAREVLHSIDADADVASVVLYGEGGTVLYTEGRALIPPTSSLAVTSPRVIEESSRIVAIHPVKSLEGPHGVLAIELSTASLRAARDHVHWMALLTGLAAIAVGILAAWQIARRLAQRLRAISNVAGAVANGDLSQNPIDDLQHDEIGLLARAFNAMLSQIKQLFQHVQDMARKEQERLESLVAQRTAQLDERNAEMRLVFDEVEQGLFMVSLDGALANERSAAVERLLGTVPESGQLIDYVAKFAPDYAAWFACQWDMLREDVMPAEVCLAQLPSRFDVNGRHLELAYKRTDGTGGPRVLVVVTDVTSRVLRDRAERDERESASLVGRFLRGRAGFLAFYSEATHYIATIEGPTNDVVLLRRAIHTLKGISGLEGIDSIAEACHALESAMEEGDEIATRSANRGLTTRWALVTSKISPLITAASDRVELLSTDLAAVEHAVRHAAPASELLAMIESWRNERIEPRLQRFADDAHVLAGRLGKGPLDVQVEVPADLRLPSERWAGFWAAFVHAVRNAIDHGIETPEDRLSSGKAETARLTLRALRRGSEIAIEIEDDGRGIDWTKVAERARLRGMPSDHHDDLVAALFRDGFTTRDVATEVSGRGIGLAALHEACISTGGQVTVASHVGTGTTFHFRWPVMAAQTPPLLAAI